MLGTLRRLCAVSFLLLVVGVVPARAQVAWDAPSLMAYGAPAGLGFHLIDPHPGDELGALVTWRQSPVPVGLGFRVGLAEGVRDDLAVLGGVDFSGLLHEEGGELPVHVIWHAGGGLGLDGDVLLSVPAGVVVDLEVAGDELVFRPYAGPKVALDLFFADDVEDDLDLGVSLEFGLDLAFSSSWVIRAAASLGDRDALSIGFHVPS